MQKLEPSWLPPGTLVGPWKVKAYRAGGSFGAVFRAVLAGREHAHGGRVALKMAWWPRDPRFEREVSLLSRLQHPSTPRLLWHGVWQHPDGDAYPYLVMEWVEGVALYEWAATLNPSSQEVLQVLAQVARALEETHAVHGVHRDVKGDNILVSTSGGRATLMDFGACHYAGAERLTREGLPPGTGAYRSPEAWQFELHRPRNSTDRYEAQPADDVFALGVSAFRLVTGQYPPPVDVQPTPEGPGRLVWIAPQPPVELNPRVEVGLSALVLRMLAVRPEDRPSASELASELETATKKRAPRAERRLFASVEQEHSPQGAPAEQGQARKAVPAWVGYAACAVLGAAIAAVAVGWGLRQAPDDLARSRVGEGLRAPEPVGLGDTGLTAPAAYMDEPSGRSISLPMPDGPLTGQRRPPHCQPPLEVSINGGCWIAVRDVKPPCGQQSYEWSGGCYIPTYPSPRQPTSEPP